MLLHEGKEGPALHVDAGIAMQTMMLGARARGLAGCMLGSIKRAEIARALGLEEKYKVLYVLALGKPAEKVVVEPLPPDGNIRYWRDGQGIHHVPKRSLEQIIVEPEVG